MTDLDLDSIRRRHDEDHEHDGGCDTLDLLAEVERLREQRDAYREAVEKSTAELQMCTFAHAVAKVTPCTCSAQRARAENAEADVEHWKRRWRERADESVLLRAAVDAVRALADRDDLTYVQTDDPISGRGVALRSRKAVADMIHAALDEHLGDTDD